MKVIVLEVKNRKALLVELALLIDIIAELFPAIIEDCVNLTKLIVKGG